MGGHYRAGERLAETLREVEEEIRHYPRLGELRPLGVRVCANEAQPGIVDREVQDVFLLRDDRPLETFRPNPAELAALVRFPLDYPGAIPRAGEFRNRGRVDGADVDASRAHHRARSKISSPPSIATSCGSPSRPSTCCAGSATSRSESAAMFRAMCRSILQGGYCVTVLRTGIEGRRSWQFPRKS